MKHMVALTFTVIALAGCATITADHMQELSLNTTPKGAKCTLANSRGSWVVANTPGSVEVPRGFEPLTVTCTLEGYAPQRATIEGQTRGRAYGNILLGGFPAYVDAGTGAGYEYATDVVTLEFTATAKKTSARQ